MKQALQIAGLFHYWLFRADAKRVSGGTSSSVYMGCSIRLLMRFTAAAYTCCSGMVSSGVYATLWQSLEKTSWASPRMCNAVVPGWRPDNFVCRHLQKMRENGRCCDTEPVPGADRRTRSVSGPCAVRRGRCYLDMVTWCPDLGPDRRACEVLLWADIPNAENLPKNHGTGLPNSRCSKETYWKAAAHPVLEAATGAFESLSAPPKVLLPTLRPVHGDFVVWCPRTTVHDINPALHQGP